MKMSLLKIKIKQKQILKNRCTKKKKNERKTIIFKKNSKNNLFLLK